MVLTNLLKKETVLLLLIIFSFGYRVYSYREDYVKKYDPVFWKNAYEKSQWVVPNSKEGIGDDGLYAYAGWEYIHGKNPILINPEMPPLGKYIFGLSIIIFGNKNIMTLLLSIGFLVTLFYLAKKILNDVSLALLVVFLVTLEPVFYDQIKTTMLEIPFLFFLLLTLISFVKAQKKISYFILTGIFLGMFFAVKLFLLGIILSITLLITQFLIEKRRLKYLFISFFLAVLIYSLSYTVFFLNSQNPRQFLGMHKWILDFYQKSLVKVFPGGPFWMLLFNRWEVWFKSSWYGEHSIINEEKFILFWPIITILSSLAAFFTIKNFKKNQTGLLVISLWLVFYLGFISFTPMWSRYLLLANPFMYILSIYLIAKTSLVRDTVKIIRNELKNRKKEYVFIMCLSLILITYARKLFTDQNYIFTPIQGRELEIIKEVVFGLTPLISLNSVLLPWYGFLTVPFFFSEGNPIYIGLILVVSTLIISYICYLLARKIKNGYGIFSFIITFTVIFTILCKTDRIKITLNSNHYLSIKNEVYSIDKVYEWAEKNKFTVIILSQDSKSPHYRYLFSRYGKTKYGFVPGFFPEEKNINYYLIIEPTVNKDFIMEFQKNNFKNITIEREAKTPAGIIIRRIRVQDEKSNTK